MKIIISYAIIGSFVSALLTGYMCRAFELWQIVTASALTGIWMLMMLKHIVDVYKENMDSEEQ